jgi:hypothetical protein
LLKNETIDNQHVSLCTGCSAGKNGTLCAAGGQSYLLMSCLKVQNKVCSYNILSNKKEAVSKGRTIIEQPNKIPQLLNFVPSSCSWSKSKN